MILLPVKEVNGRDLHESCSQLCPHLQTTNGIGCMECLVCLSLCGPQLCRVVAELYVNAFGNERENEAHAGIVHESAADGGGGAAEVGVHIL
jgi:hypothetical protein